jgi:hypothetical protein
MATTSTSTAVAAAESVFTEPERLALAGFLAGYTGLTREAYALDLRQLVSWYQETRAALCTRRLGIRTAPQPRLSGSRSCISVGAARSLLWGGRSSSRYRLQEVSGVQR